MMREKRIGELKDEVARIENRLDDLLKELSSFEDQEGRGFDVSVPIPKTDSSVSDIRARHATVAGLVKKMERKGGDTIPLSFFNASANAIRSISNAADQIGSEIRNINSWQGLRSLSYENFLATAVNGTQRDLSAPFKTLFDSSEAYLASFHTLFQAINPSRASFNFSAASDALSKVIARGTESRNEFSSALKDALQTLKGIEAKEATLATLVEQAQTNAASISEQLGRSNEALGQIDANRVQAKEITEAAEELEAAVNEYQATFDVFAGSMAERNKLFEKGRESFDSLISEFIDQKEFVRSIIEQSNNMLLAPLLPVFHLNSRR
jgi:chromosome segregation ATPase